MDGSIALEHEAVPRFVRQRVVERVPVAVSQVEHVPVLRERVVDSFEERIVPWRKLVEVEEMRDVDEEYTVVEERQSMREREVWVRQVVVEPVTELVPVTRTRTVARPTRVLREIEGETVVRVPASRTTMEQVLEPRERTAVQWEDVELVQTFELHPTRVGPAEVVSRRSAAARAGSMSSPAVVPQADAASQFARASPPALSPVLPLRRSVPADQRVAALTARPPVLTPGVRRTQSPLRSPARAVHVHDGARDAGKPDAIALRTQELFSRMAAV